MVGPKPVPLFALWSVGTRVLTVAFDQLLKVQPLEPANWALEVSGWHRNVTAPTVSVGNVISPTTRLFTATTRNVVSYAASPPDVQSELGVPADPFVDFPVFPQP